MLGPEGADPSCRKGEVLAKKGANWYGTAPTHVLFRAAAPSLHRAAAPHRRFHLPTDAIAYFAIKKAIMVTK